MEIVILFLVLGFLYFLPTTIAIHRGHSYKWVILGINVIGFWIIPWVAAFVWAVWPKEKSLLDPVAGNVTGKGRRNIGDTFGANQFGVKRGYSNEEEQYYKDLSDLDRKN